MIGNNKIKIASIKNKNKTKERYTIINVLSDDEKGFFFFLTLSIVLLWVDSVKSEL